MNTCGGCSSGRNPQPHRRVCWRDPQGPWTYINPPTWESAPERSNLLVGREKWLKACREPSKQHCSLSDPSPTYSTTVQQHGLPYPGKHLRLHPLQCNRYIETKKYCPNERTDQNSKKRTKQWRDSQSIRCRVQNTGNQDAHKNDLVRMQNRGRSDGHAKWNKEKCTGNQQWREGNQDSNQWFGIEGRNKHSTGTEWRNKNLKKWGEA